MTKAQVRVRFAPSPTGPLHIGGVRTALYNYLLAKKTGGVFILRIEDTDQKRFVPGAEQYIKDALVWAGIDYDEGPDKNELYGPYRQSERKEIYQKYIQQLIDNGWAYYAFDTAEELEAMRERLKKSGKSSPKYDLFVREYMQNSLALPQDEVQARLDRNEPYVIRLKVPRGEEIKFEDEIRGWVSVKSEELDDKVLVKSDGLPTYHLANIVDDHLMKISHVIRGEEWLPSAPLHVLLYRAFGWEDEMPSFAHLPLILKPDPSSYINKGSKLAFAQLFADEYSTKNELDTGKVKGISEALFSNPKDLQNQLRANAKDDGVKAGFKEFVKKSMYGKLSKRDGDRLGFPVFPLSWEAEGITGYKESGYLPDAFLNILVMLGWNPGTSQELFTLAELTQAFSLERVGKSGAKFDPTKAKWYNQQFLRRLPSEVILSDFRDIVTAQGVEAQDDYLLEVLTLIKEKASFASDFWDLSAYFFQAPSEYNHPVMAKKWDAEARVFFEQINKEWTVSEDFTAATLEADFSAKGDDAKKYMQVLRVLVTGQGAGPALFPIIALLGKQECLDRMQSALSVLD